MSDKIEQLCRIYNRIPRFECVPGCNECCVATPISKVELDRLPPKEKTGRNLVCQYSTPEGCEVYDKRPYMCRIFGTVEDLQCPAGGKARKTLTVSEGQKLTNEYIRVAEPDFNNILGMSKD